MNSIVKEHIEKLKEYCDNLNELKTITIEDKFWLQYNITKGIKFVEDKHGIIRPKVTFTFTQLRDRFKDDLD